MRILWLALVLTCAALPLRADPLDRLWAALRMDDTLAIMRDEGLSYGDDLARDMLGTAPDAAWRAVVARVYDTDKMAALLRPDLQQGLAGVDLDPLIGFFESPAGQVLIASELDTRRAFTEQAVEDAARLAQAGADPDDPVQQIVGQIIAQGDMVEFNLSGALNANVLFYRGLVDTGALDMPESDILADVWAQEDETRADTRGWLLAYLSTSYRDLPLDSLRAYRDLGATGPGQALNAALFAGFDRMYGDISYALGLAVGSRMIGEDL